MSFETLDKVWKGSYLACLYDAYTHFNNCHKLMQIKTKPTRAVITTDEVKARELRLVPLTTAITFNKEGENVANAICVGQAFKHPTRGQQTLAWLSPRCTLPKSAQLASGSASSGPETFSWFRFGPCAPLTMARWLTWRSIPSLLPGPRSWAKRLAGSSLSTCPSCGTTWLWRLTWNHIHAHSVRTTVSLDGCILLYVPRLYMHIRVVVFSTLHLRGWRGAPGLQACLRPEASRNAQAEGRRQRQE